MVLNLNANPSEIYFTSKIEHPAVLDTCKELEREGFEISYIGVDEKCTSYI